MSKAGSVSPGKLELLCSTVMFFIFSFKNQILCHHSLGKKPLFLIMLSSQPLSLLNWVGKGKAPRFPGVISAGSARGHLVGNLGTYLSTSHSGYWDSCLALVNPSHLLRCPLPPLPPPSQIRQILSEICPRRVTS